MSLDLRLLEVPLEFELLEEYWGIIEKQMERSQESARRKRDAKLKKLEQSGVTPCDVEWDCLGRIYDYEVSILLPRILYNPFLVSLYSVYESIVIEIADLMQKKSGLEKSINDRQTAFLKRANSYYKDILELPLSKNKSALDRLSILSDLRNAIVHTNGRLDLVNKSARHRVDKWVGRQIGIQNNYGYIVVSEDFLRETFTLIKSDLDDLVARYKERDSARKEKPQAS